MRVLTKITTTQKDMKCIVIDPLRLPEDIKSYVDECLSENNYFVDISKLCYLIRVEKDIYLISWGAYCESCIKKNDIFKDVNIKHLHSNMYNVRASYYSFAAIGFIEINIAELVTLLV